MEKYRVILKLLGLKGFLLFFLRRFKIYSNLQLKDLFKLIDWSLKTQNKIIKESNLIVVDWKIKSGAFKRIFLRPYSSDPQVFNQHIIEGELLPIVSYFEKFQITPKLMIDGGGNIGLATLFILAYFPNVKSYVFEPNRSNFEMLNRNLTSDKVILEQRALWFEDGWVYPKDDSSEWGFSVGKNQISPSSKPLPAVSLFNILEKWNHEEIDYLKLDIEGAEEEIFYHHEKIFQKLKRIRCISVEPHSREFEYYLMDKLEEIEFKVVKQGELLIGFNKNLL